MEGWPTGRWRGPLAVYFRLGLIACDELQHLDSVVVTLHLRPSCRHDGLVILTRCLADDMHLVDGNELSAVKPRFLC